MNVVDWRIPPSVIRWMAEAPADEPVAVLLRHSVRDRLPDGDVGYACPITEAGAALGRELGALIESRLRTLHTSPVPRCVQTAEVIRAGAAVRAEGTEDVPIVPDRLLGDPGVYVVDGDLAGSIWKERGNEAVMAHLASQDRPFPGMADPGSAARFLVQHMLIVAGDRPGLHVFVTHDSLVSTTAARLLGEPLGKGGWPWYLEGAFFWRQGGHVVTAYRDRCNESDAVTFSSLDERDVVDFARREAARTIGPACDARFFLAGGMFKTLLTGRPASGLDLWAPSARDRALVLAALTRRGARRLEDRPFADTFAIDDRIVVLPHEVEPDTLDRRLARFDVALSAVGVEHRPGGRWSAVVHPLARTSVERREVLLLKPLVNRRFVLSTLERMRRYADELGYTTPAEEEAELWRVFESQPEDMKREMLARYERTARGGYGVRGEAARRSR